MPTDNAQNAQAAQHNGSTFKAFVSQPMLPEQSFRQPTPPAPPYSPITPELSYAVPTTVSNSQEQEQQHIPPTNDSFGNSTLGPQHLYHPQPSSMPRYSASRTAPSPYSTGSSQGNPPSRSSNAQAIEKAPKPAAPPLPRPLDLQSNPDAIAVRAAMSILHLQRQQALADMSTLESQKALALQDPEVFAQATATGKVRARERGPFGSGMEMDNNDDEMKGSEDTATAIAENEDNQMVGEPGAPSLRSQPPQQMGMELPAPQNVVRMPHVNWSQYHVVGESLDKLHDEQRARPAFSVPDGMTPEEAEKFKAQLGMSDEDQNLQGGLGTGRRENVIAAPYDPFMDRIEAEGSLPGNPPEVTAKTTPNSAKSGTHHGPKASGGHGSGGGSSKKKGGRKG